MLTLLPYAGEEGTGGGEGKELCEDEANEANAATDNDAQTAKRTASEVNCAQTDVELVNSDNDCDNKEQQKTKCDVGVRDTSTRSDDSYHILSSRLSESDITSAQQNKLPSEESPTEPMETDEVDDADNADDSAAPLDFSIKPNKKVTPIRSATQNGPLSTKEIESEKNIIPNEAPLDLSVGKRLSSSKSPISAKVPRFDSSSHPWSYTAPRVLTPPKQSQTHNDMSSVWNGKIKNNLHSTINKLSPSTSPSSSQGRVSSTSHSGRQNPWQTQWINRSSEQTRDVFTCVWCKESFRSLAEMTDHMKKSPRCGMAGMQHAATTSTHTSVAVPSGAPPSTASHSPSTSVTKEPISSSVLAKNNVGLPRKLVRGQDVWLGRGAEQTRQILKCMWCGQSFKTLADMTTHMRVTQHYTNIISQEQIISWRTPEDKLTQAQVNAVLTCKVCDEAFGSLKELSYHMVKNAHYKEHILRSITEGGHGRRRQTRERRKKSLPVRKLLELERREMTKSDKEDDSPSVGSNGQLITCDECHEKVDAKSFLSHIKLCKMQIKSGIRSLKVDKSPERTKSPSSNSTRSGPPSRGHTISPQVDVKNEGEGKTKSESDSKEDVNESNSDTTNVSESPSSFGSVLNAIERLIEKSFDSKSRKAQTTGILQRLGIDEEVCPPWQHMPQVPWSRNGCGSNEFFSEGRSSRSSGRHSSSPLPHDMLKENSRSLSSHDSSESCDDSNSCNSLTNNIEMSLKSSSSAPQKLSFPISSLLPDKRADDSDLKLKNLSPKSDTHSSSGNSNPQSPNNDDNNNKCTVNQVKRDEVSDISEDEKASKSPKIECISPTSTETNSEQKQLNSDDNCNAESAAKETPKEAQRTLSKGGGHDKNGSSESDSFHPLMQLQKLLDKTDSGNKNKVNNANSSADNNGNVGVSSSLLAFSWACNDATTSSSEDKHKGEQHMMKCAFCDTHFISKGAYRHHLSKMHFIKTDKHSELPTANSNNNSHANSDNGIKESGGSSSNAVGNANDVAINASESPHSKFLKYTELAKQLSSKYV